MAGRRLWSPLQGTSQSDESSRLDKIQIAVGVVLALENAMSSKLPQPEVLVGRTLALCVHPYAAWRSRSLKGRALVLFTYMVLSYFVVLAALLSF